MNYNNLTKVQKENRLGELRTSIEYFVINPPINKCERLINNCQDYFFIKGSVKRDELGEGIAFSPVQAKLLYNQLKEIYDCPRKFFKDTYEVNKMYYLTHGCYLINKHNIIRFFNDDKSQILFQINSRENIKILINWLKEVLGIGGYFDEEEIKDTLEIKIKACEISKDNEGLDNKLFELHKSNIVLTNNKTMEKSSEIVIYPNYAHYGLLKLNFSKFFYIKDISAYKSVLFSPLQAQRIVMALKNNENNIAIPLTNGVFEMRNEIIAFSTIDEKHSYILDSEDKNKFVNWLIEILIIGGYVEKETVIKENNNKEISKECDTTNLTKELEEIKCFDKTPELFNKKTFTINLNIEQYREMKDEDDTCSHVLYHEHCEDFKKWLTEILTIGGYVKKEEPSTQEVRFEINPSERTTKCCIDNEEKGTTICNKIDKFDFKKGKLISFARALDFDNETVERIIDALFPQE